MEAQTQRAKDGKQGGMLAEVASNKAGRTSACGFGLPASPVWDVVLSINPGREGYPDQAGEKVAASISTGDGRAIPETKSLRPPAAALSPNVARSLATDLCLCSHHCHPNWTNGSSRRRDLDKRRRRDGGMWGHGLHREGVLSGLCLRTATWLES